MENFEPVKNYETYGINKKGEIKDYRSGKIIPQYFNQCGYKRINLRNPNGVKGFLVHRLVGIQFLEPVEGKYEIDHIDRDKKNNNIENLRWVNDVEQAENRGDFSNNKLGEKFIRYEKSTKGYTHRFRIQITKNKKKIFDKSLKCSQYTLEDAIKIRDDFLASIN
jgi:hypothetical protein